MFWWALVAAALIAAPIVVRLRTGKWGNAKLGESFLEAFRGNWQRQRNTPYALERKRAAKYRALSLLFFGLPLCLLLIGLCDCLNYDSAIYVPVVCFVSLSLSIGIGTYLSNRNAPPN
jgi:hypothetical protein